MPTPRKSLEEKRRTKQLYRALHAEEMRAWQRTYRAEHAIELKEKKRLYREQHREQIAAKKHADYIANPESMKSRVRRWNLANPDAATRRATRWRKNNLEKYRLISRCSVEMRRARKLNQQGEITIRPDSVKWVLSLQHNRCAYCNKPFTTRRKPSIDHIHPISKGGLDSVDNFVLACVSCNSRKSVGKPPVPVQPLLALG